MKIAGDVTFWRLLIQPASLADQPARRRKMMKGNYRFNTMLMTGSQHPAVVFEFSMGELAFFRFNAGPFSRKAIGIESKLCK